MEGWGNLQQSTRCASQSKKGGSWVNTDLNYSTCSGPSPLSGTEVGAQGPLPKLQAQGGGPKSQSHGFFPNSSSIGKCLELEFLGQCNGVAFPPRLGQALQIAGVLCCPPPGARRSKRKRDCVRSSGFLGSAPSFLPQPPPPARAGVHRALVTAWLYGLQPDSQLATVSMLRVPKILGPQGCQVLFYTHTTPGPRNSCVSTEWL